MDRDEIILWLGEPACGDPALAGGKAAALSRLARGRRVPFGFCLTTRAYAAARADRDGPALGARQPALPRAVADQVAWAYRLMGEIAGVEAPAVAVRSSAVGEDGESASYAGQHATALHVAGIDAVAAAVVRCWDSATSVEARAYRRARGEAAEAAVAVLVQEMVMADAAAVLFTANPLSGNAGEMVITAAWGLGESLVGGTVTPDTYVVRKADLTILTSRIAAKRHMTVAIPVGTREVDVPRSLQARPALGEDQVAEIARLGLDLEAAAGRPVDVECAYQAGSLYLLQSRPITTLVDARAS